MNTFQHISKDGFEALQHHWTHLNSYQQNFLENTKKWLKGVHSPLAFIMYSAFLYRMCLSNLSHRIDGLAAYSIQIGHVIWGPFR